MRYVYDVIIYLELTEDRRIKRKTRRATTVRNYSELEVLISLNKCTNDFFEFFQWLRTFTNMGVVFYAHKE